MSVVFALATPPAKSAICIFRVSGPGCLSKIPALTGSKLEKNKKFYLRPVKNERGDVVDRAGIITFKGPDSYTGEDSFEVHAHGGLGVMAMLVSVFKSFGFDEAPPGEFTKRAFLNNKISLAEAEAVVDLIDSHDRGGVVLSAKTLSGDFTKKVLELSGVINNLRVRVEGEIDFSDEGESFFDSSLPNELSLLIENFKLFVGGCLNRKNHSVKNKIMFLGPVNSGKSSVFNRLLGFERALVSDRPGTTRDLIESEIFYNEVSFSISDTAGLRETEDVVESKGMQFALENLDSADLVIGVFDSDEGSILDKFSELAKEKKYLKIYNKTDLGNVVKEGVFDCMVSAKSGEGFDELKRLISKTFKSSVSSDYMYLVRDRHIKLFQSSVDYLENAYLKLNERGGLELVAEDLKLARNDLNEIVGIKMPDSLLGDIFSSFCIGK
jgi:tRNA modification GTPase